MDDRELLLNIKYDKILSTIAQKTTYDQPISIEILIDLFADDADLILKILNKKGVKTLIRNKLDLQHMIDLNNEYKNHKLQWFFASKAQKQKINNCINEYKEILMQLDMLTVKPDTFITGLYPTKCYPLTGKVFYQIMLNQTANKDLL